LFIQEEKEEKEEKKGDEAPMETAAPFEGWSIVLTGVFSVSKDVSIISPVCL